MLAKIAPDNRRTSKQASEVFERRFSAFSNNRMPSQQIASKWLRGQFTGHESGSFHHNPQVPLHGSGSQIARWNPPSPQCLQGPGPDFRSPNQHQRAGSRGIKLVFDDSLEPSQGATLQKCALSLTRQFGLDELKQKIQAVGTSAHHPEQALFAMVILCFLS